MNAEKVLPQEVDSVLSMGLLKSVSPKLREEVFSYGMFAEYPDGVVINRPNDPVRIALILSGKLRLYYEHDDGKRLTICRLLPGDLAGVVTLASQANSLYAQTEGATRLWVIPANILQNIMRNDPSTASLVISELGRHLEKLVIEWITFAFSTVEERILHFLRNRQADTTPIKISQQQLADEIGTAREVVTRAIRKLKDKKQIKSGSDGFYLCD